MGPETPGARTLPWHILAGCPRSGSTRLRGRLPRAASVRRGRQPRTGPRPSWAPRPAATPAPR
eukprot:10261985-Lingulodinium_polyedra.AAC.1